MKSLYEEDERLTEEGHKIYDELNLAVRYMVEKYTDVYSAREVADLISNIATTHALMIIFDRHMQSLRDEHEKEKQ